MKCENCGKNEVSFIYQSNINGRVTEKHLCGECADKLGYTQKVAAQSRRMMEGMRSAFSGFFAPERSLLGAGGLFGQELFDDFFRDMPALDEAPAELAAEPQRQETDISREEQGRFARMRELNKLLEDK